jgi:hypothetical protein
MITVTQLRDEIAALKVRRTAVLDSPISKAERDAAVLAWCVDQSAAIHDNVHHFVAGVAYGGSLAGLLQVRAAQTSVVDLAPFLAHVIGPDVLARSLCKHFADTPEGLSAAERAEQLAAADEAILDLELAEEKFIVASEIAGAPIARRADADPRAVLWIDPDDEPPAIDAAPPRPAPAEPEKPRRSRVVPSSYMAGSAP